jgi:hypothetical protein
MNPTVPEVGKVVVVVDGGIAKFNMCGGMCWTN